MTALLEYNNKNKVLRLLESLKQSPHGKIIYKHVSGVLEETEQAHLEYADGISALIRALFKTYRDNTPQGSRLNLELLMIENRLYPPISEKELDILRSYITRSTTEAIQNSTLNPSSLNAVLQPFLSDKLLKDEEGELVDALKPLNVDPQKEGKARLRKQDENFIKLQHTISSQINSAVKSNDEFIGQLNGLIDVLPSEWNQDNATDAYKKFYIEAIKFKQKNHDLSSAFKETIQAINVTQSYNADLNKKLDKALELSLTDELTGLPNRRAFMERLSDEITRAQKYNLILSLAIIDIDNFKSINDEYGHSSGDHVLKTYAKEILSDFRNYDMLARYGGEEFIVLLPSTDEVGGVCALEKIRKKASITYYKSSTEKFKVPHFSAGLTQFMDGDTVEKIIERADTAMYKAKDSGKDRIEVLKID